MLMSKTNPSTGRPKYIKSICTYILFPYPNVRFHFSNCIRTIC